MPVRDEQVADEGGDVGRVLGGQTRRRRGLLHRLQRPGEIAVELADVRQPGERGEVRGEGDHPVDLGRGLRVAPELDEGIDEHAVCRRVARGRPRPRPCRWRVPRRTGGARAAARRSRRGPGCRPVRGGGPARGPPAPVRTGLDRRSRGCAGAGPGRGPVGRPRPRDRSRCATRGRRSRPGSGRSSRSGGRDGRPGACDAGARLRRSRRPTCSATVQAGRRCASGPTGPPLPRSPRRPPPGPGSPSRGSVGVEDVSVWSCPGYGRSRLWMSGANSRVGRVRARCPNRRWVRTSPDRAGRGTACTPRDQTREPEDRAPPGRRCGRPGRAASGGPR